MTSCHASTVWADVPPHGVRLACVLSVGHAGDHAGDVEYLEPAPKTNDPTDEGDR